MGTERVPPRGTHVVSRSPRVPGAARRDGDLVTVEAPVDPRLEVAEIHRRVIAAGGPALLFTNVNGAAIPAGHQPVRHGAPRASWRSATRPLRLIKRLVELAETLLPPTPAKLWGARDVGRELLQVGMRQAWRRAGDRARDPRRAARSRCRRSRRWPEDGGPFITLPLVYTSIPTGTGTTSGMYRMQVHDARTTGHALADRQGRRLSLRGGRSAGQPLPVTVFLGGPPALILSAIAPLPENVPELMLASLIAGRAAAAGARASGRIRSSPTPSSR